MPTPTAYDSIAGSALSAARIFAVVQMRLGRVAQQRGAPDAAPTEADDPHLLYCLTRTLHDLSRTTGRVKGICTIEAGTSDQDGPIALPLAFTDTPAIRHFKNGLAEDSIAGEIHHESELNRKRAQARERALFRVALRDGQLISRGDVASGDTANRAGHVTQSVVFEQPLLAGAALRLIGPAYPALPTRSCACDPDTAETCACTTATTLTVTSSVYVSESLEGAIVAGVMERWANDTPVLMDLADNYRAEQRDQIVMHSTAVAPRRGRIKHRWM